MKTNKTQSNERANNQSEKLTPATSATVKNRMLFDGTFWGAYDNDLFNTLHTQPDGFNAWVASVCDHTRQNRPEFGTGDTFNHNLFTAWHDVYARWGLRSEFQRWAILQRTWTIDEQNTAFPIWEEGFKAGLKHG